MMRTNLRQKLGTCAVVLLITVWLIPTTAGAFAPGDGRHDKGFDMKGHHRPALGIWRNPKLVQKLGLTAEEVKQFKDADFTFREKRLTLKAQLDGFRLQMDKGFSDDIVDDTAVLSLAEKIADIKGKLFIQDIESRLALGKILNADQIKKLKLHDMFQQKQDPRHGEKNIPGRHSIERPDDKKHFEN